MQAAARQGGGGGDGKTFGMVFPGPGGWYSPRAAGELRERGGVAAAATGDDKNTVLSMDD